MQKPNLLTQVSLFILISLSYNASPVSSAPVTETSKSTTKTATVKKGDDPQKAAQNAADTVKKEFESGGKALSNTITEAQKGKGPVGKAGTDLKNAADKTSKAVAKEVKSGQEALSNTAKQAQQKKH